MNNDITHIMLRYVDLFDEPRHRVLFSFPSGCLGLALVPSCDCSKVEYIGVVTYTFFLSLFAFSILPHLFALLTCSREPDTVENYREAKIYLRKLIHRVYVSHLLGSQYVHSLESKVYRPWMRCPEFRCGNAVIHKLKRKKEQRRIFQMTIITE